MLKILFLIVCVCGFISLGYPQDSTKKTKQVKVLVKHQSYKYHQATKKADTAAVVTFVKQDEPAKPDTAKPTSPTDKSLRGQYQFLLTKVYRFQQPNVQEFWRNASDSLKISKRKIKESEAMLGIQHKAIDSLREDITDKNKMITASNAKVNEVSLLGIPLTKSAYNMLMWGLVIVFGITAAVVITRSGIYSREAKYRTNLYTELEEEYKTYKAKANDKEKKLARELQTERNKVDELLGR